MPEQHSQRHLEVEFAASGDLIPGSRPRTTGQPGRLREADRKIESLALIDVYGRVARLLLDQAEEIEGQWIVRSAPPKQEIARMIGASREMVSRVVKDLQQRGYIRAEKRKVFLLDKISMTKRASNS